MQERYRQQPRVDKKYLQIVRDPELLAVAKEESMDIYKERYTRCYDIIPDPDQRDGLISMAINSIDKKWKHAIETYSQTEAECLEGNSEACKIKPDHEIVLGMFLQAADSERREMGVLPFIGEPKSNPLDTVEPPYVETFPAPSHEPVTLIEKVAD